MSRGSREGEIGIWLEVGTVCALSRPSPNSPCSTTGSGERRHDSGVRGIIRFQYHDICRLPLRGALVVTSISAEKQSQASERLQPRSRRYIAQVILVHCRLTSLLIQSTFSSYLCLDVSVLMTRHRAWEFAHTTSHRPCPYSIPLTIEYLVRPLCPLGRHSHPRRHARRYTAGWLTASRLARSSTSPRFLWRDPVHSSAVFGPSCNPCNLK